MWFLLAAMQRLDTTAFHARAKLGGVGRQGYDPDMLLTLLVYAMAHGESSSRQIERLCHTDVAFRIICAGDVPDHRAGQVPSASSAGVDLLPRARAGAVPGAGPVCAVQQLQPA